jgi:thiol:disulfide interchange protein
MANQSRSVTIKQGLAFSGGVILSFWILASALLILQTYGRSVGWGFQLQEPLFVAFLAAVLLMFGLSLFGVFELGTSLTAAASDVQSSQKQSGYVGSFFSGILATAVATPCTGPFLGSAVGFAVTLPPFLAMMIFTSLGLGMALPYLLLALNPSLMRFLPKPGAWMEVFKELTGFVMLATVLWLVWVFGAQTNTLALTLVMGGFVFIAIGCWILGKWGTPIKSTRTRLISYCMTLICLGIAGYAIALTKAPWVAGQNESASKTSHESIWEPYSEERIAELQQKGIPVFVDFTAKWCLICQTNHMVLSTDNVSTQFDQKGVVRMKADWTKNDEKITKALRKFGRNGVPLYVLYGSDSNQPPAVLPQVLTPDVVLEQLQKTVSADTQTKMI